jgi:hypothetical protein
VHAPSFTHAACTSPAQLHLSPGESRCAFAVASGVAGLHHRTIHIGVADLLGCGVSGP